MKARLNQVSLGLTIAVLSALTGGCGLLGGGESSDLNVQPSPQPVASKPFPKPSVPATLQSPSKIALTRPTNPDDRLRVIKSGRTDPFKKLIETSDDAANGSGDGSSGGNNGQKSTNKDEVGKSIAKSYSTFLDKLANAYTKPGQPGDPSIPGTPGGSLSPTGTPGTVSLPTLPTQPELAKVQVTGVVVVAGAPRAIVQAPDEPNTRTVGVGDTLSGGKLTVKEIDMSNRNDPTVVFQQGDLEFSVAVGREPVLIASAMTEKALKPVRGMYSVQSR